MEKSRKTLICKIAFLAGIYLFMLVCNLLTPMLVDDYTYVYSFVDGSEMDSVLDIFPSIAAHASKMNGRHVAHFFAQLFLFIPQIFFKLLNPAVFCLLLYIIARIASKKVPTKLMALGFGLVFVFEPVFGQVNLWLDGACNYLFSYVVSLLWFVCFVSYYEDNEQKRPLYLTILTVILGFFAGGWNENVSAATIFMVILAIIWMLISHRKVRLELWLSLVLAVFGFLLMALAPAESANKISDMDFGLLRENIVIATNMLAEIAPLILLYAALLTLSFMTSGVTDKNIIAVVLALGGLASNYIMIFATYYHERSAAYTAVLFAAGCVLLCGSLWDTGAKKLIASVISLTLVLSAYFAVIGVNDIYLSWRDAVANEEYLIACRDSGEAEAEIAWIHGETKYSPVYGMKYIDVNDPASWPNYNMSKFYGLDVIYGRME